MPLEPTNPTKYIEKVNFQYRIANRLLMLFSAPFIVWQMGILYYSGNTMALEGRTPIPPAAENTAPVIVAGYLSCILAVCLFPRWIIWIERVLLFGALAASVFMLYPLPVKSEILLFYITAFVCVFSIGAMASVAAHQFTVETTLRDGVISMVLGGVLIGALQSDAIQVDFRGFTFISTLLIAAHTAFYCLIPAKIEVPYVSRQNKVKMPKMRFVGIWFINGFSTLLTCFVSSYAESVENGVSVLYFSAAAIAALLYLMTKRFGGRAIRMYGMFLPLTVMGFVLAFVAPYFPGLRLIICGLHGFVVAVANFWIFFAAESFRSYPTRFIGALSAGVGLSLAMFHSGLLALLQDNTPLLYGIYAVLSAAFFIIYHIFEPYFTYEWTRKEPEKRPSGSPELSGSEPFEPEPSGTQPSGFKAGRLPEQREEGAAIIGPDRGAVAEETPAPGRAEAQTEFHSFGALSEQERILAELILNGYTESSIAQMMNITLNTQKSYRKNLYAKLDIHSKRELFKLVSGREE